MALFNCIECGKEISDKASVCPYCGMPYEGTSHFIEEIKKGFPEININQEIGTKIKSIDALFRGEIDNKINYSKNVNPGINYVQLFEKAIVIVNTSIPKNANTFTILFDQIISIESLNLYELIKNNKSVIGRAIIGGILTGGFGALIGGISALSGNTKEVNKSVLVINYWDINSRHPESILIKNDSDYFTNQFIKIFNSVKNKESSIIQPKETEEFDSKNGNALFLIALILVIMLFAAVLFFSN